MPPSAPETFDLIVLGSGQAGNPLASAFSAKGKRVALIERAELGGTCVNYGCTPTKTMVASAEVAYLARRASDFGIHTGEVTVDMPAVRERKRAMVAQWIEGDRKRLGKAENVTLLRGEGSFSGPRQLRVRMNDGTPDRTLTADLVVLDTGLSPAVPRLDGIDTVPYLDNTSVMELAEVPAHLLILGGGYIGLEFAQMFRRFGSAVTVVQSNAQLLPQEDTDIVDEITRILREDGIEILLGTRATAVANSAAGLRLTITTNGHEQVLDGTHLLVATGRKPNTAVLNLAATGVNLDQHGFIQVDEKLATSSPGIYAVGDVNGGPAFTHISYDDFRILKANLLDGGSRTTAGRPLPYCVFIDPQLGRIGLSEKQAAAEGREFRVAKLPMSSVARALETSQPRGLLKALVDPNTKQILGAAILGQDGGELMSMLEIAIMGKLPYTALADATLAHPTYAESLNNLFSQLDA